MMMDGTRRRDGRSARIAGRDRNYPSRMYRALFVIPARAPSNYIIEYQLRFYASTTTTVDIILIHNQLHTYQ